MLLGLKVIWWNFGRSSARLENEIISIEKMYWLYSGYNTNNSDYIWKKYEKIMGL
jgi:hypothetical protein